MDHHTTAVPFRLQVDLRVAGGRTATSAVAERTFEVAIVSWIVTSHGVVVYAHDAHGSAAAIIAPEERDGWPHPGAWFTQLADLIEAGR